MPYSRNNRFQQTRSRHTRQQPAELEFKCIQCEQYVSCAPLMAAVQNRNHCPASLWSRHLDWGKPAIDWRGAVLRCNPSR